VGTRLFGTISNITDYGCFVEIEDGVEGLVHVSEMDWTNKNVNPAKVVHTGDEVEVMVLDIDEERRRISLGMKQCQANPWESFAAMHNKGDKVSGASSLLPICILLALTVASTARSVRHFWQDTGEDVFAISARAKRRGYCRRPRAQRISWESQLDQILATFMAENRESGEGKVKSRSACCHRVGERSRPALIDIRKERVKTPKAFRGR
jgi:small subunit ribosomal protein S1